VVSALETTVKRLVALEASTATAEGAALEVMEETVALEVRKRLFLNSTFKLKSTNTVL